MSDTHLDDTKPDHPVIPSEGTARLLDVEVGGRTHPGRVRPNNEDNFHVVRFGRYLQTVRSSLPVGCVREEDAPPGHLFAVADGVGGHVAGEIASQVALAVFVDVVLQTPDWILGRDDELLSQVMSRMARRFRQVNEAIHDLTLDQPGLRSMGTTLSLAVSLSDVLIVAHVGDSRAYLFRSGKLHRLTRDHTIGQQLDGKSPVAAQLSHVLTRCIGGSSSGCEPDVAWCRLSDGDRLLLCTDGLTDLVDDATILRELGLGTSSDEVCRALIEQALDCGGRDNITVVVATYHVPVRLSARPLPTSPT